MEKTLSELIREYKDGGKRNFEKIAETGDILLFLTDHTSGKLQRFLTNSDYDHVAMVIRLNGDLMVFEANHDVGMLRSGPYPEYLKKRILGNRGHLSNLETGRCLARMGKKTGVHVFLAHLSQHNNCPDLALSTVSQILDQQSVRLEQDLFLHLTRPSDTVSFSL